MSSQRISLRWNAHQSNLFAMFGHVLNAATSDVSLVADGQLLKAHKIVLSACSPYFNTMLAIHPEQHPIIILQNVSYSEMKTLLHFMYYGEVSVAQEHLTSILRVAESLRIMGLTDKANDANPTYYETTPPPPQ